MSKVESHLDLPFEEFIKQGTPSQLEKLELMALYAPKVDITVTPRSMLTSEELSQLPIDVLPQTLLLEAEDRIIDIFSSHGFTYKDRDGQTDIVDGNLTAAASILKILDAELYSSLDIPEDILVGDLLNNLHFKTGTLAPGNIHWLHNINKDVFKHENLESGIIKTQERFKNLYKSNDEHAITLALALKRVGGLAHDLNEKDARHLFSIGGDKALPQIAQLFPDLVILGKVSEKTIDEQKESVIKELEDLNSSYCLKNSGVEPLWVFSFLSDLLSLKEMVDFNNKNTTSEDLQVA